MTKTAADSVQSPPDRINVPFDIISMSGKESVEFLQRISSNDVSPLLNSNIAKTLFISDKGRVIDTVLIVPHGEELLLLISRGLAGEILTWLQKYIIMEDIQLVDRSDDFDVTIQLNPRIDPVNADYFGTPAHLSVTLSSENKKGSEWNLLDLWRIERGIPAAKREITGEYNPLELNLREWISFTKGCYIGQEVIARLDTYNKVQRALCVISAESPFIKENELIVDTHGEPIGKVTSVAQNDDHLVGLAVLRTSAAIPDNQLKTKETNETVVVKKVFMKEYHGRN